MKKTHWLIVAAASSVVAAALVATSYISKHAEAADVVRSSPVAVTPSKEPVSIEKIPLGHIGWSEYSDPITADKFKKICIDEDTTESAGHGDARLCLRFKSGKGNTADVAMRLAGGLLQVDHFNGGINTIQIRAEYPNGNVTISDVIVGRSADGSFAVVVYDDGKRLVSKMIKRRAALTIRAPLEGGSFVVFKYSKYAREMDK